MIIKSLFELENLSYTVTDISAIFQTPIYRTGGQKSRRMNGFLLIKSGGFEYEWGAGEHLEIGRGALVYLPKGANYSFKIPYDEIEFYRINFTLSLPNGDPIIFAQNPTLMCAECDSIVFDTIDELCRLFKDASGYFKSASLLYRLFDIVSGMHNTKQSRIKPAIDYITGNFTRNIDCKKLAEMCYMSQAQMYRLFKLELGKTPLEYRDKLRTDRAKMLLSGDENSIGEIAFLLGYDSLYYFSRSFKENTGISPSSFRKSLRGCP